MINLSIEMSDCTTDAFELIWMNACSMAIRLIARYLELSQRILSDCSGPNHIESLIEP